MMENMLTPKEFIPLAVLLYGYVSYSIGVIIGIIIHVLIIKIRKTKQKRKGGENQ